MKTLFVCLLAICGTLPSIFSDAKPLIFLASTLSPENQAKTPYIKQKEIELIDNELESLINLREYYTLKMSRYRTRAMRYELQGENLDVSKHLFEESDKMENVIKQIDEEMLRLERNLAQILKQ